MESEDCAERLFAVVEFIEEQGEDGSIPMAVVSNKWLQYKNDKVDCLWPNYLRTDADRIKAVKEHTQLPLEKCGKSLVNIKYRSRIFANAVAKLKHLEDVSSVSQSETEPENSKRNKKTTKVRDDFQYSSGSEESDVPPPPRFARDNSNQKVSENTHTAKQGLSNSIITKQTGVHAPIRIESQTTINPSNMHCSNCRTSDGLIQKMMQSIELLTHDVKYLIQLSQLNSNIVSNDLPHNPALEQLPVYTVEQLLKFNEYLHDKEVMAVMCTSMQVVGGKDVVDTTRRIMSNLMRNCVAIKCNWSGRNGKLCFESLKDVMQLIVTVVRKNPLSRNSTQQEIQAVIKVWLRNAPDRDGGRMHRKQNPNKATDKD